MSRARPAPARAVERHEDVDDGRDDGPRVLLRVALHVDELVEDLAALEELRDDVGLGRGRVLVVVVELHNTRMRRALEEVHLVPELLVGEGVHARHTNTLDGAGLRRLLVGAGVDLAAVALGDEAGPVEVVLGEEGGAVAHGAALAVRRHLLHRRRHPHGSMDCRDALSRLSWWVLDLALSG